MPNLRNVGKKIGAERCQIAAHIRKGGFLDRVLKNFASSFPYGLTKTEVTRLTFLASCMKEASKFESAKEAAKP